jgi:adenylate kinase
MLRAAVKNGTEMGLKAQEYMTQGALVPDEVVIGIVRDRIAEPDVDEKGFLLDGFPRTVGQADALDKVLGSMSKNIDAVINIVVPDEELLSRLTGRRICKSCQKPYHMVFSPPQAEGVCDTCSGELYQRADDTIETVKNRLDVYHSQTVPLIAFYNNKGVLFDVDGTKAMDEVFGGIKDALETKV